MACATAAAAGDALLIRGCGRTDFQEGEQNLVDLTPLIDGGHVSAAKVHASRTRIMHVSMFEWSPCFTRNVQQVHEWGYTFKGLATYVASAALEGSWVADASGSKLTMRGFTSCTPKSECGRDGQATPHMQRTFAHILPRMFTSPPHHLSNCQATLACCTTQCMASCSSCLMTRWCTLHTTTRDALPAASGKRRHTTSGAVLTGFTEGDGMHVMMCKSHV